LRLREFRVAPAAAARSSPGAAASFMALAIAVVGAVTMMAAAMVEVRATAEC